jgi:GntR family transcriptional regulator/MocR family aminotransferase
MHSAFLFEAVTIDRHSPTPIHRQVYAALRQAILNGHLGAGNRLPPTRSLAEELGLGRNTIMAAYDQLLAEGLIEARTGSGTRVAESMSTRSSARESPLLRLSRRGELMASRPQSRRHPGKINLQPGVPESATFPFAAWAKILARNARRRADNILGYEHFAGDPGLRQAIAEYLAAARGAVCEPEQVIVVAGAQAGIDLAARVLLDGGDDVWMEEPGYLGARSAFLSSGGRLWPLRVSRNGWNLNDERLPRPRLIFVTPSCHWPLGTIMRIDERLTLLALAERAGAWIIEDDYDGEYHLRGRPVPALRGLDSSGRVIYVGTFGKTLFSSLRVGYLVVPRELAEAFDRAVSITGQIAPLVLQCALADFLNEGHFATHLRRMRRLYARRQKEFVALCNARLGRWLSVSENDSGMQVVARFKSSLDDRAVVAAAMAHGVHVQPVSVNFHHDPPEQGLLLGFAALGERDTRLALGRLAAALEEVDRDSPRPKLAPRN